MAYSYIRYTGNGSTTNFAFSFPYLNESNVKVFVNGVDTARTFLNASTVVVSPAPASGAQVEIRRVTVTETPPVDFQDGSTLLETDLDLVARYNLYTVQESLDIASDAMAEALDGTLDADNRRIKNVADPVNAQDAVTKNWVETGLTSQYNQALDVLSDAQDLVNQNIELISRFTISTNDPSGGQDGDVWFKVAI